MYLLSLVVILTISTVAYANPFQTYNLSEKLNALSKDETVLASTYEITSENYLKVKGMIPQNDNLSVRSKSFIVIIFDKEIVLKDSEQISLTSNGSVIESLKEVEGNKLLIHPTSSLSLSTTYKVSVDSESISSSNNEYLEQDFEKSFTTASRSDRNLQVVKIHPESPGVMLNDSAPIQLFFNKVIVPGESFSNIQGSINGEAVEVEARAHGMVMDLSVNLNEISEGYLNIQIPESSLQDQLGEEYNEQIELQYTLSSNLLSARSSTNSISSLNEVDRSYYHKRISSGSEHTLIINDDNQVFSWLHKDFNQIGFDNPLYDGQSAMVTSLEDKDIVSVSAGDSHSLALASDGTVWAWGDNTYGQLGDGTYTFSSTPVQVVGIDGSGFLNDIVAISAGWNHNLAVSSEGNVFAWGTNEYGQLGDGGNSWDSPLPIHVLAAEDEGQSYLEDIIYADAGAYHSVALKADGTAYVWGDQWRMFEFQIDLQTYVPTRIEADIYNNPINNVKDIQASPYGTILLTEDGKMLAKGAELSGEFGQGRDTGGYNPWFDYIYFNADTVLEDIESFDITSGRYESNTEQGIYISAIDTVGSLYSWGGWLGYPRIVTEGSFISIGNSLLGGMSFKEDGTLLVWNYNRILDTFDYPEKHILKEYVYDKTKENRLTSVTITIDQSKYRQDFIYDGNGNLISKNTIQIE